MRILHVLDHSLPLQSGYTFRTAAILREQRALGWETAQLTSPRQQPGQGADEAGGFTFHRTPITSALLDRLPGGRYVREMEATARRLDGLVRSFRPDVLHAHSPVLNVLPALRIGRRHRIPVVCEVRAFWEDAAVDLGATSEGSTRYRLSRMLETHALRRADHVTTICEGLRGDIVARGVAPERVTVIPNAVDVEAFRYGGEGDAALRASLGLRDATVVGFAGSFYAYEGLDLLIDAAGLLRESIPRMRILLVGGGPQESALRARVAAAGLQDRVVFTGRVPHADVQRYYELVDVMAYPRRRMRLTDLVTPLKPLEAMAQGRLVVASDVGGHRELLRDGDTGLLFEAGSPRALADALARVLGSREQWPAMRKRARAFVEKERTWARSVAGYVGAYARARASRADAQPGAASAIDA